MKYSLFLTLAIAAIGMAAPRAVPAPAPTAAPELAPEQKRAEC